MTPSPTPTTTKKSVSEAYSRMASAMWPVHDQILAQKWEIAREIYSRVDSLNQQLDRRLQHSMDPAERIRIRAQRRTLRTYAALSGRTWVLYDWARNDEGKAARPENPWETEPAAQSTYAEALGLEKDEHPISPMKGMIKLTDMLLETYEEGARLFY